MSREWKPGDDIGPVVIDWNGTAIATLLRTLEKHYEPGYRALWSAIHRANAPSPLAVIDPEDREQVERLAQAYLDKFGGDLASRAIADQMQAALREFASPTPPKPDEPMGLGAVVEDDGGDPYVFTGDIDEGGRWWFRKGDPFRWGRITAVRVLSEGVRND